MFHFLYHSLNSRLKLPPIILKIIPVGSTLLLQRPDLPHSAEENFLCGLEVIDLVDVAEAAAENCAAGPQPVVLTDDHLRRDIAAPQGGDPAESVGYSGLSDAPADPLNGSVCQELKEKVSPIRDRKVVKSDVDLLNPGNGQNVIKGFNRLLRLKEQNRAAAPVHAGEEMLHFCGCLKIR